MLNKAYAEQIARDCNTADAFSGYIGIVTSFDLPTAYLDRYDVRHVGGAGHDELWIPADELQNFNEAILRPIRIEAAFTGIQFQRPERAALFELTKNPSSNDLFKFLAAR